MPLLSICIPVYQAEPYLRQCVEPLLSLGSEVQILLSDDGSTDGSAALCRDYAAKYSQVVFLQGENGGPSAARNRALPMLTGEYVVFADSDDVLEPSVLRCLKEITASGPVDLVQFGVVTETAKGSVRKELLYPALTRLDEAGRYELLTFICGDRDGRDLGHDYFGLVTCKIFRTECIRGLRFDEAVVGEDTLFAVQAMMRARELVFLPEYLYHYRIVQGSYSHRPYPGIVPKAERMLTLLRQTLQPETDPGLRHACDCRTLGMLLWCISAGEIYELNSLPQALRQIRALCRRPVFAAGLHSGNRLRLWKAVCREALACRYRKWRMGSR